MGIGKPKPVPEVWDLLGRFLFDLSNTLSIEGVRERRVRIVHDGCEAEGSGVLTDISIGTDKWVTDSLYTDGIVELIQHEEGRDKYSIRAANWTIITKASRVGDSLELDIYIYAPKYIFNTILSEVQKVLREKGVEPEVEA